MGIFYGWQFGNPSSNQAYCTELSLTFLISGLCVTDACFFLIWLCNFKPPSNSQMNYSERMLLYSLCYIHCDWFLMGNLDTVLYFRVLVLMIFVSLMCTCIPNHMTSTVYFISPLIYCYFYQYVSLWINHWDEYCCCFVLIKYVEYLLSSPCF